jgi:hypothetical protein
MREHPVDAQMCVTHEMIYKSLFIQAPDPKDWVF